jgi:pimeloyl-ACP methyl ester carboxylesterase
LKVSLVGWSRGGIIAREVARQIPDAVCMVITLGSPFAAPGASNVRTIWKLLTGQKYEPPNPERVSRLAKPIPVPSTSIYTRADGVGAWRACLEEDGGQREKVEVNATHIGLGFHMPALWVIALIRATHNGAGWARRQVLLQERICDSLRIARNGGWHWRATSCQTATPLTARSS